jgi:hypothetical protein
MGPSALFPLRRVACWGFFRRKNLTASTGCEPANLGTKGQNATSRPPKPFKYLSRLTLYNTKCSLEHPVLDIRSCAIPWKTANFRYVKFHISIQVSWSEVFGFVHPPLPIRVHMANTDDFRAKMSTFILMTSETCLYLPIIAAALLLYAFFVSVFLPNVHIYYATFEALTAVLMNIQVFWHVPPYWLENK